MRIVSLTPSATEILFALGLDEEVVGVSARCDTPPEVVALPRVTSGAGLRVERILDLEPDLVVLGGEGPMEWARQVRDALETDGADCEVLVLNPTSVEGIFNAISTVGAMTEAEDAAMEVVEELRERLRGIEEIVMGRLDTGFAPPRVVALSGLDPLTGVGLWVPDQVRLAGGWEVAGREGTAAAETSWTAVAELDPEILAVMPDGRDLDGAMAAWVRAGEPAGWGGLTAVMGGRAFLLDGRLFSRPGPGVVDGIEALAELIDPVAFDGMAPPDAWARIP